MDVARSAGSKVVSNRGVPQFVVQGAVPLVGVGVVSGVVRSVLGEPVVFVVLVELEVVWVSDGFLIRVGQIIARLVQDTIAYRRELEGWVLAAAVLVTVVVVVLVVLVVVEIRLEV